MKKLFSLLVAVLCVCSMWAANPITLTFKDTLATGTDGKLDYTTASLIDSLENAAGFVTCDSVSKAYAARIITEGEAGLGVKLGSSSYAGYFALHMVTPAEFDSVVIKAAAYGSSEGKMVVNGGDVIDLTAAGNKVLADYTYIPTGTLTSLVVASSAKKQRIYVKSITFYPKEGAAEPQLVDSVWATYQDYSAAYPNYNDSAWGMVSGAQFKVEFYSNDSIVIRNWMNQNVDLCMTYDESGYIKAVNNPGNVPSYWAYADNSYWASFACLSYYSSQNCWYSPSTKELLLSFSWGTTWDSYHLTWAPEPTDLYVIGTVNGWVLNDSTYKMTETVTGSQWTYDFGATELVGQQFKINDGDWTEPYNLGSSDKLIAGTITLAEGGDNISIADNYSSATNVVITLDKDAEGNFTLTAAGTFVEGEKAIPDLYLRGAANDWGASEANKFTKTADNEWTITMAYDPATWTQGFKVADANWGDYNFGAGSDALVLGTEYTLVSGSNSNLSMPSDAVAGDYTFTVSKADDVWTLLVSAPAAPAQLVDSVWARYEDYSADYVNYTDPDWGMVSGAKFKVEFYDNNTIIIRNWMNQNVDLCMSYDKDGYIESVCNPDGELSYWAYASSTYWASFACLSYYNSQNCWYSSKSKEIYLMFSWGTTWDNYHLTWADESALENVDAADNAVKVMENGVLYILKNGIRYNALGAVVE